MSAYSTLSAPLSDFQVAHAALEVADQAMFVAAENVGDDPETNDAYRSAEQDLASAQDQLNLAANLLAAAAALVLSSIS
jgi:hypothetical protein